MTSPKGNRDVGRATAFGLLLRKLRRESGLTLSQLAKKVHMSPSNLSRLELGSQSPPADEVIESIAAAVKADPEQLLHAAGRRAGGPNFEEEVLEELKALRKDVQAVKSAVSRRR